MLKLLITSSHLAVFQSTFNPFPNKPWFLRFCSTSLLKTPWEKEKLLVTSNFSFSHSVFYPFRELSATFIKLEIVVCNLFQVGRVKNLSFGKRLNLLQKKKKKLGDERSISCQNCDNWPEQYMQRYHVLPLH